MNEYGEIIKKAEDRQTKEWAHYESERRYVELRRAYSRGIYHE